MNYQVELYSENYIIVALNDYEGDPMFVLRKVGKEEEYIGVAQSTMNSRTFKSTYVNLKKFEYLLENANETLEKAEFYNINKNYKYKVEYKLRNKWIVSIYDNETKRIYDFKHKDFKEISKSEYIIRDHNKYKEKCKYVQKNQSIKDIEKMYYYTDQIICEVLEEWFNCKYYYDLSGTLRITNGDYTKKEAKFAEDLNEGWRMFYDKEYTFEELIRIYTKLDYSVNGFMEVFSHRLISENVDEMSEKEIKKDIRKIIEGKKPHYE